MKTALFYVSTAIILLLQGCERLPVTSPGSDTFPPAVPSGLQVSYEADGEVELIWERNYEPDIESYTIYRRPDSSGGIYTMAGRTFDSYFFDTGLEYNVRYIYRITAEDNAGNISAFSDSVIAAPVNLYAPRRPRNLLVYGQNLQGKLSVELSWAKPFDTDIAYFQIHRGTDEAFVPDALNQAGNSQTTRFTDSSGLQTGIQYFYKLIAVDKGGLKSIASSVNSDIILPLPEIIYPRNGDIIPRFYHVRVSGIPFSASYRLILQSNEVSGMLWSTELWHNGGSDEVSIPIQTYYLSANRDYYIRIETYRKSEVFPNGITAAVKFAITN